jgi:hypothetical protein
MKKHGFTSRIGLIVLALFFYGCSIFDKADDVTFSEELTVTWTVDENQNGQNVPYTHSESVNLEDYPEIKKYINKIKSVNVERITYRIMNYDASPHHAQVIFSNGKASFASQGAAPVVEVPYGATATGVNLQTSTSETDLAIDQNGLNKIGSLLKDNKKISMQSSGTLSQTPVSFVVESRFYVTITANALN